MIGRLRTAAKLTMYHGTAAGSDGQILRRILKEGLNPNPPKRSFDVQRDKPTHERSLESLGGVYFSRSMWDIRKFSLLANKNFGGDRVGVVAQIETRGPAITIDEDDLFPLSSRGKIADHFFRGVYHVVEASDYLLLNDMESGTLDYVEMAEWFVDNVVAEQWNISPQEKQRIVPAIADVAELQVLTQLASESERYAGQYWSVRHLYEQFGPKESAAELFEQLKAATQRALAAVRRAANLPKDEWKQSYHKVRVTEPVGYGGANRILAVFHWDDDYDRYKQNGYYLVGRVDFVAAGAQQYITQMIQFFAESSSQDMLWTDQKGKVLYDQRNPEIVNQKAASVLRYRGARYRLAKWEPLRFGLRGNPVKPAVFRWRLVTRFPNGVQFVSTAAGAGQRQVQTIDWRDPNR